METDKGMKKVRGINVLRSLSYFIITWEFVELITKLIVGFVSDDLEEASGHVGVLGNVWGFSENGLSNKIMIEEGIWLLVIIFNMDTCDSWKIADNDVFEGAIGKSVSW